ncbi:hypothetical protein BJ878DRAFT_401505, partial [Calycina marina]
PYDLSDIIERAKDDAIRVIAEGRESATSYYWQQASETNDCLNWIAKRFLYKKFRYNDGSNCGSTATGGSNSSRASTS